jgi:hypothetical protein
MSNELPFIMNWYNGKEQFSLVSTCFEQETPDCNYCWGLYACVEVSFRLSSDIWPPPRDDHWMRICFDCWRSTVTVNPRYVAREEVVTHLPDALTNLVLGYLD